MENEVILKLFITGLAKKLMQLLSVSQKSKNGLLKLICLITVDDILAAGFEFSLKEVLKGSVLSYKFRSVANGPGRFRFYGLNIVQHDEFRSQIDGDEKLSKLCTYKLRCIRRRSVKENLNAIQL